MSINASMHLNKSPKENNSKVLGILGCHHGRYQEEDGEAVQRDVRGRGQENDAAKDDDEDDSLNWWFVYDCENSKQDS